MGMIYLFRGMPACGKTTITNLLSQDMNINVIRKDDIFDKVYECLSDRKSINILTYNIMSSLLQTQINNNNDCIIDAGLTTKSSYYEFIKKIDLKNNKLVSFLCVCSDKQEWKSRIEQRVKNPLPHQPYKDFDELISSYNENDLGCLNNEIILDSSEKLTLLFGKTIKAIKNYS